MLGLGQHICRHKHRIRRFVCNDQHLARPRNGIDAHRTHHRFFRHGYVAVAWACDLIHLRHGLRAVGKGCYGLCAAHAKDQIHAAFFGCYQREGRQRTVLGRGRQAQFAYPRNLCRHCVHNHARRIGCRAARRVKPYAIQRQHELL